MGLELQKEIVAGYAFRNRPELYLKVYQNDFNEYPDQRIRLDISKEILKKNKVKSILDVGCGSCVPLFELAKEGFTIKGIDINPEMIKTGKVFLKSKGVNPELVSCNILDNLKIDNKFDCVLNLGAFPHTKDDDRELELHSKFLKKKGKLIMELRNELFGMFTFNSYTMKFFDKLIPNMPETVREFFKKRFLLGEPQAHFTDPYYKTNPRLHNPLTIGNILKRNGFELDQIYFYHYHYLPPVFEKDYPDFNQKSLKLEEPSDWRGNFLASAFVVEATKL